MSRRDIRRRSEPDNYASAKFWLKFGFCILMAVIVVVAVYIGGLAQYGNMLVDPT